MAIKGAIPMRFDDVFPYGCYVVGEVQRSGTSIGPPRTRRCRRSIGTRACWCGPWM